MTLATQMSGRAAVEAMRIPHQRVFIEVRLLSLHIMASIQPDDDHELMMQSMPMLSRPKGARAWFLARPGEWRARTHHSRGFR